MTRADAYRAFGPNLAFAALLLAGAYLVGIGPELCREYDVVVAFENGFAYNFFGWLVPLVAALPFASAFCVDWQSRSAIAQVLLAGRRDYVRSKWLCAALSGGLVCAGGLVLFYLALLPGGNFSHYAGAFPAIGLYAPLKEGHIAQFVATYAYLQFLIGACYATIGLLFSAYCPNVPLSLCAPLLFQHLCGQVMKLTPQMPKWVNLPALCQGAITMDGTKTLLIATGIGGAVLALNFLAFALGVKRRLEHG
ncbi:MAG: hypothetical protein RR893_10080 [Clostridia bacterium]